MEIKNFIVPIDFSEESLKGLQLAILFSRKTYVNIQMVYVLRKSAENVPGTADLKTEQAKDAFKSIIDKYTPELKNNSKLRYIIKKGKVYQEIVNQAQSYKDSVVTASTHGASGFEEFFIGSNAYKIISATRRPVITIRKGKCPEKIKKIVLPIDISGDSRQKVPLTAELAKFFNAEIHILATNISRSKRTVGR